MYALPADMLLVFDPPPPPPNSKSLRFCAFLFTPFLISKPLTSAWISAQCTREKEEAIEKI